MITPSFVIEHATTDDLPNGIPVPPPEWLFDLIHVVRRHDGFTVWRRISLTTEPQTRKLET